MKNSIKNLGKVFFSFLVVIGFIGTADIAFSMMNKPSTLSFVGGLGILLFLAFFLISVIVVWSDKVKLSKQSKSNKNKNGKH